MRHTRYKREEVDYTSLTKRERQIYDLLIKGLPSADIAYDLGVKEKTIKFHLTNIYRKLGVSGRQAMEIKIKTVNTSIDAYTMSKRVSVLPTGVLKDG